MDAFTIMRIARHSSIVVSRSDTFSRHPERPSVLSNVCSSQAKWRSLSRNDAYPLQFPLQLNGERP